MAGNLAQGPAAASLSFAGHRRFRIRPGRDCRCGRQANDLYPLVPGGPKFTAFAANPQRDRGGANLLAQRGQEKRIRSRASRPSGGCGRLVRHQEGQSTSGRCRRRTGDSACRGRDVFSPSDALGRKQCASPHRGKKTKKATFLPLAILGGLLAIAAGAVAVVMSHQPELQESRADSAPDQNPGAGRETSPSKSSANESKPVPTGSVKPAATGDGTASAATSGSLSKAGDLPRTSADAPDRRPRGNAESSSNAAPDVGDDPATRHAGLSAKPKTSAAAPAANPEAAVQTVSAAKSKTPEELDKQLADAKTDEEYRAVVVDALRAADKSTDDGQPAAARQLVLKALVAARKSGDSKLVYGVTRALTIPDSLKKTLAELKSE